MDACLQEIFEKQVELFRLTPLKNLHRQLSDGLLDGHLKFAKDLYDDIAELLREFDPDTEIIQPLKESINNLVKQVGDLDYILIGILIN
ncbi:hypothetical protein INT45_002274 [Circinella minor]|uniref:Uncharacterized protein n=1 Tax=Circinella minor TaxID=1195481 RepID=A0A8H7VUI7_9FUNG|nr:hypothetical protein INT45_002274 [Circinella minor]